MWICTGQGVEDGVQEGQQQGQEEQGEQEAEGKRQAKKGGRDVQAPCCSIAPWPSAAQSLCCVRCVCATDTQSLHRAEGAFAAGSLQ